MNCDVVMKYKVNAHTFLTLRWSIFSWCSIPANKQLVCHHIMIIENNNQSKLQEKEYGVEKRRETCSMVNMNVMHGEFEPHSSTVGFIIDLRLWSAFGRLHRFPHAPSQLDFLGTSIHKDHLVAYSRASRYWVIWSSSQGCKRQPLLSRETYRSVQN